MLQLRNENDSQDENGKYQIRDSEPSHPTLTSSVLSQPTEGVSAKNRWDWTGFGGKKLWDWLQFAAPLAITVAIPFAGALVGSIVNAQQQATALDDQRQKITSTYLDEMTKLLLEEKLRQSPPSSEVRSIARARTLNALRQLDGERRGQLLKFLYETNLIGQCQSDLTTQVDKNSCKNSLLLLGGARLEETTFDPPIPLQGIYLTEASLAGANLSKMDLAMADMQKAHLEEANLSGAILRGSHMEKARLTGADLSGASLFKAHLEGAVLNSSTLQNANLQDAKLGGATLINTNLQGANLNNTDFQGTDLRNADLTGTTLQGADLKGAWYNDATKFPEWSSPDEKGMRFCPLPIDKGCD